MHSNMCTGQDMFVGHVWYENSGMSDISYVVSSGVFGVRHSSDQCFWVKLCYGNYYCIKTSRLKCACMYLVTKCILGMLFSGNGTHCYFQCIYLLIRSWKSLVWLIIQRVTLLWCLLKWFNQSCWELFVLGKRRNPRSHLTPLYTLFIFLTFTDS